MQTNVDGVFAGGDVVMFPFQPRNNKKVNIPHWQMAHVHGEFVVACSWLHSYSITKAFITQLCQCLRFPLALTGKVAALSMMGRATEVKTVPYFWSAMFGKTIRYAGRRAFQPSLVFALAWKFVLRGRLTVKKRSETERKCVCPEILVLHCHLAEQKWSPWPRIRPESDYLFLFVEVMVTDLTMSLYKEIWMNCAL